ncbi:Ropporin-1-like protein [Dufourea novaeangliae]|uniref:Ropporin-1-like protein n=1 Tax=Dufourea novaeangliae TaxID=178035 RepID=A0A154P2D6_DUFNO|nr:Ropporin-1-like protein [Dufourea novaeangliae]
MSVIEQSTVGHEIIVPASLPIILKQFCKAAIRTQPYDLLKWSSSYFRALADGEEPPTKLRLEYPPPSTVSGLTLGFLRILLRQFGDYNKSLPVETILRRWDCLCLDRRELNLIMMIGKFRRRCQVKKFLAIAVGLLGSSLFETMVLICELFTLEPEGGSAMVPVTLFMEIYGYLAGLRCDGSVRDSSDDDPTEFIMCSEANGFGSLASQDPNEGKFFVDRVYSVASQDTEADVNLDLELVSKEDVDSSRSTFHQEQESSSEGTLKVECDNETSGGDAESSKKSPLNEERKSNKSEIASEKGTTGSSTAGGNASKNRRVFSADEKRRKKKILDSRLLKYYPNVPGIGPRLSAEEVASVAIWMSECARVQEGMVGPRNLRHMNCPSLDRQQQSSSS